MRLTSEAPHSWVYPHQWRRRGPSEAPHHRGAPPPPPSCLTARDLAPSYLSLFLCFSVSLGVCLSLVLSLSLFLCVFVCVCLFERETASRSLYLCVSLCLPSFPSLSVSVFLSFCFSLCVGLCVRERERESRRWSVIPPGHEHHPIFCRAYTSTDCVLCVPVCFCLCVFAYACPCMCVRVKSV